MPKAIWNGAVLAESDDPEVVEGNHYFPAESIHREYFRPSDHTSVCGWKGTASYCDIVVNDSENPQAAWYYPSPKDAATNIKGRIAFWKVVEVQ